MHFRHDFFGYCKGDLSLWQRTGSRLSCTKASIYRRSWVLCLRGQLGWIHKHSSIWGSLAPKASGIEWPRWSPQISGEGYHFQPEDLTYISSNSDTHIRWPFSEVTKDFILPYNGICCYFYDKNCTLYTNTRNTQLKSGTMSNYAIQIISEKILRNRSYISPDQYRLLGSFLYVITFFLVLLVLVNVCLQPLQL